MNKKQMYRAYVTVLVDGVCADSEQEADEQIQLLIDQVGVVQTDLEWQEVDWTLEEVFEYDTDYSGNLPKDEI
jgi:hypothetical protein